MPDATYQRPASLTVAVSDENMHHFREMVREQILGDQELLRHAVSGREDPEIRWEVGTRLRFVRELADLCGLPEDVDRRRPAGTPRPRGITGVTLERARCWALRRLLA